MVTGFNPRGFSYLQGDDYGAQFVKAANALDRSRPRVEASKSFSFVLISDPQFEWAGALLATDDKPVFSKE